MHDIVAHSLTVIVALSDGAGASLARAGDAPASATEAVRQTGITARRALTDMRRSLGVLAESAADARAGSGAGNAPGVTSGAPVASSGSSAGPLPAALAPQPGTADLPELIATFRAAGLPVRYTTVGDAPPDPVLQLSVYRVVQESLTNALRYAQGVGRVDVDVRYDPAGISISVEDDGLDPARGAVSEGWGRGLIGLRERVQVHGGTVSAGPVGSRGWRVAVRLGAPAPVQTSVAGVSAAPTFLAPGSAVPTASAPTSAPTPIDPVPEGRS
jgi:signal transduction histidine kinase